MQNASTASQRLDSASPLTSPRYRAYVLAMLVVVYVFNFLDRQIVTILAEPIKNDLGLNDTQIGLMTGLAFAIFYTVLGIPIARLADRANRYDGAMWHGAEFYADSRRTHRRWRW